MKQIYTKSSLTFGTKFLSKTIKTLLIPIALLAFSGNVWGKSKTFYAQCKVVSEPAIGGYVADYQQKQTSISYSLTEDETGVKSKSAGSIFSTPSNTTIEFYAYQKANNGFTFKGWADSNTANTGSTSTGTYSRLTYYPLNITTSSENSNSPQKKTFYAIFAGIVNKDATPAPTASLSFDELSLNASQEKQIIFQHAHAGKITGTFGGANQNDFKLKAGTSLPSSSTTLANCTITIVFTPSCSGNRTATLTLKGDNGGSMAISLTGSGKPEKPSITTSNGSVNVTVGSPATTANLNNRVTTNADGTRTFTCNSSAVTISGSTFSATEAGDYTVNVNIAQGCTYAACSGSFTMTVNHLNPTLNMSNGSVNVTTDKSNPVTLDLAGLKASSTTSGIGAFDKFELQSADASTGAKAEGVTINGSTFYSTVGGKYTVRATTKQNNQYNSTYKDFTVTVNRLEQDITWSTEETIFVEGDEISASAVGDVTFTVSGDGAAYVSTEYNKATILAIESEQTTVTLIANAARTDVYNATSAPKTVTLTHLQKQVITFDQPELLKLKTTDATKKVKLTATSNSGRDSYITFEVSSNTAGVTVTKEQGKWYLNYSATAAKGIMVTAKLAGVDGQFLAASPVSQMVKVIDPNAACDIAETLETANGLANTSKYYNLTVPKKVVLKVRSSKSKIYTNSYQIKFYDKNNNEISTGQTQEWTGRTWDQTVDTRTFDDLDISITKMEFKSNASNGFDITEASYTRYSYVTPSVNKLDFEAYALSTAADQTFTVDYANYQIELEIEGSSNFVLKSEDSFGDCGSYGTQTVKIGYKVPAEAMTETAYLRIKDNGGNVLSSVTLNAKVKGGLEQTIQTHNVESSYNTTDAVTLSATTNRGLTNFTYSATPDDVVTVSGDKMTFSKPGTIAVTINERGNNTYNPATLTIENIEVKAVTPVITTPEAINVTYLDNLSNDLLASCMATVTLRGVANTEVAGEFVWDTPAANSQITAAHGSYTYQAKFTPTGDAAAMYNGTTFDVPVTVNLAESAIAMNNGSVVVSVDEDDRTELELATLITPKAGDGAINYEVTSDNKAQAKINNGQFYAFAVGDYTIHATMAQTDYYTSAETDFTITVVEGKIFNGTSSTEWSDGTKWEGGVPSTTDRVIIDNDITISGNITIGGLTINAGKTVTVADGATLTVGDKSTIARENNAYGNIIVEAGGQLKLNEDGNVQVNDFTLYSSYDEGQPKSGQVSHAAKLHTNGNAYFILDLDPSGYASYGWYDFTVPFPVDVVNGVTRIDTTTGNWLTIKNEVNYAVMAFYEDLRAQNQYAWKKYRGILEPGRAYTMTIDSKINTYRFAMTRDGEFNTTLTQTLEASAEGEENGWNGVGNGTMQYIKLDEQPVVQMYQHTTNVYLPVNAGTQAFAVGSSYFVQKSDELSQLTLKPVQDATSVIRAPQRERNADERFGVTLTQDNRTCDNLFVTCSEEATPLYTRGKDVQKMGDIEGAKIARMWTNAKGKNLCAIYTAYNGNEAIIPMQIYAPAAGTYNLALDSNPAEEVYLTRNGIIVWNLTMSDYELDLNAGTDDSYALKVVRRINNVATSVDATDNRGTIFVEKMIVNDQLFILRDGILYDAQGKRVADKK